MRTRPDQVTGLDTDPYREYAVPVAWTQYAKTDETKGECAVERDGTEEDMNALGEVADPAAAAADTMVKAEPASEAAKTEKDVFAA